MHLTALIKAQDQAHVSRWKDPLRSVGPDIALRDPQEVHKVGEWPASNRVDETHVRKDTNPNPCPQ